jgi:hypothetical protein
VKILADPEESLVVITAPRKGEFVAETPVAEEAAPEEIEGGTKEKEAHKERSGGSREKTIIVPVGTPSATTPPTAAAPGLPAHKR